MATKKKPSKSRGGKFLSRSQLDARAKRAARWARIKEVLGVALVVLTVAAIISLLSHHPKDRSFNAATSSSSYQNYLGWFGAYLSDLLVQLLGLGAYFLPLFTFVLALGCFVRLSRSRLSAAVRFGGAAAFALAVLGLASLTFSTDPLFESAPAGGLTGGFLSSFTSRYLGTAGAYLLFIFALVSSVLAMTGVTIRKASSWTWQGILVLWSKARQKQQLVHGRAVRTRSRQREKAVPEGLSPSEPEIIDHLPARKPRSRAAVRQEAFDFQAEGSKFELPPLSLLEDPPENRALLSKEELIANSRILERKLKDFGVLGKVTQVHPGPVITMYEFQPAPGVKVNRIVNLADDLALAMSALAVRVVAPIPGKAVVGIELPNHTRETVHLKDVMLSDEYRSSGSRLTVALGKDIFGRPKASDLSTMPHVLIAGATGAGKSVMINSMVCSILFNATPAEVQFLMIDPKMV